MAIVNLLTSRRKAFHSCNSPRADHLSHLGFAVSAQLFGAFPAAPPKAR
jgi:hypothetical protein